MEKTVVLSALRTPIGKYGGSLSKITAPELGSIAIKESVKESKVSVDQIDYVIMGEVLQAGVGQIPSRQATIEAGLPFSIGSETINRVCASSLRAVTLADQMIRSGDVDVVIAGGMESMSNSPFSLPNMRWGQRMFNSISEDLMIKDGLWCSYYNVHMATHGGKVAAEYGISRKEQDEWALRSQKLAQKAIETNRIQNEIIPIKIKIKNESKIMDSDESPRFNVSIKQLEKLPPLFDSNNTVTAGNAPSTNDAAGALVLASESKAKKLGLKSLATIVSHAQVSLDPAYIAAAPGEAINKLLKKNNLTIDDIDLFEVNEAFAAVVLVSQKIAKYDLNKVNINGGAIAYGHPIGATGGRIITTLIHEMRRQKLTYGVAAICSGGGQGDAILVKCDY